MATTTTVPDQQQTTAPGGAPLLVSLGSLVPDALRQQLATVAEAFAGESVVVCTPDGLADTEAPIAANITVQSCEPAAARQDSWTLTAADFVNTFEQMRRTGAKTALLLGPEAQSLSAHALRNLAQAAGSTVDLAFPHYDLPARSGLVNSAILYPLSRALFGVRARYPLALDLGLSSRMAERLATVAQRSTAAAQSGAMLWPGAEAAIAGYSVTEVEAGPRTTTVPANADLNSVLSQVAGSLFADAEVKAAFWQRARPASAQRNYPASPQHPPEESIAPMIDAYRLAYGNLIEIWSLVLPPQSLVGLKRLAALPADQFRMADSLWARTVYDFMLAYRLRTLNRGHLLGALTPLYLAWVASHLQICASGTAPEAHVEAVATAFEADKPYLVSRWRWPDRFNP